MQKSRREIEVDFSRAMNQAEELEEVAKSLTMMARESLVDTMAILRNSFAGDNGALFMKKSDAVSAELFDTAEDLIKTAKSIRETANIIYRAEKSAITIFN